MSEHGTDLGTYHEVFGQAIRDAIRYQREHREVEDWIGQIGIYRAAAAAHGLELRGALDIPVGRVLSPEDVEVVRAALVDATDYRADPGECFDCREDHGLIELCADLARADAYRAVAVRLGDDR